MVVGSMNNLSLVDDEHLPACYRTKESSFALPSRDLEAFLAEDLSVDRIEQIASHLWTVGRPQPPRPLNIQVVLNREIIPTTDASLHLVWTPGRFFVKPLPIFFFTDQFYERYLQGSTINKPALGLLFSHISLVRTELDFELARGAHLIPSTVEWKHWKSLSRRLIESYPDRIIYAHLPIRYKYGELRLSRLDTIYRYLRGEWLHGYTSLLSTATYAQFISDNLAFVAGVTVYIAVVLNAMQVALSLPELSVNESFTSACYGFAIFAIISPIAALALIAVVFIVIFFANLWRTALAQRDSTRGSMARRGVESTRKSRDITVNHVVEMENGFVE